MEQRHKDIIKKNYDALVKHMNVHGVLMHLRGVKVLSEEMKQTIEIEKTQYAKSRKLLSVIQRRGPFAFAALRTALLKAGNNSLAKNLKENVSTDKTDYHKELEAAQPLIIDLDNKEENKSDRRCMLHIGDNFYVVANTYKDQLTIHIREFKSSDNGSLYPTKKGVTFPLERWLALELAEPYLADCFETSGGEDEELSWHLGGGVYATKTPQYPTVDIRHFWKPQSSAIRVPTKKGVVLTRRRFENLRDAIKQIREFVPELEETVPCMMQDDHQNQEGMLRCPECTPFGYDDDVHSIEPLESEHEPAWSYE